MTAYFDERASKLSSIFRDAEGHLGRTADSLESFDLDLVWDVTICATFAGFPEDLRTRVHATVLRYSAACQPVNGKSPCYESPDEHRRGLSNLLGDLHTIFHDLSQRNIPGFSDDPRSPLRVLYATGEEIREGMVETWQGKEEPKE